MLKRCDIHLASEKKEKMIRVQVEVIPRINSQPNSGHVKIPTILETR